MFNIEKIFFRTNVPKTIRFTEELIAYRKSGFRMHHIDLVGGMALITPVADIVRWKQKYGCCKQSCNGS